MRVEALRRVCVQSDVQRVRVVKHLQVFCGRGRPRCRKGAVPALVARYFVISRATEEARDRRGDELQRVAEPVERPDDGVLANGSNMNSSLVIHPIPCQVSHSPLISLGNVRQKPHSD